MNGQRNQCQRFRGLQRRETASETAAPRQAALKRNPVPVAAKPAYHICVVSVVGVFDTHCHRDALARAVGLDAHPDGESVIGQLNAQRRRGMLQPREQIRHWLIREIAAKPADAPHALAVHANHRVAFAQQLGQVRAKRLDYGRRLVHDGQRLVCVHKRHAAPAIVERKPLYANVRARGVARLLLKAALQRAAETRREYAQSRHQYQQQRHPRVVRGIARHLPHPHSEPNRRSAGKRAEPQERQTQRQGQEETRVRGYAEDKNAPDNPRRYGYVPAAKRQELHDWRVERAYHQRGYNRRLRRQARNAQTAIARALCSPVQRRQAGYRRDRRQAQLPSRIVRAAEQNARRLRARRNAHYQVHQVGRIAAYEPDGQREQPQQRHRESHQYQRGNGEQRLVHRNAAEQPRSHHGALIIELPKQEYADDQQHHIKIEPLKERLPGRARRLLPMARNADAGRAHGGYEQRGETAQPAQRAHHIRAARDEHAQRLPAAQPAERGRVSQQTDDGGREQRRG